MRYGLFDDNGSFCGYSSDNYEEIYQKAIFLNRQQAYSQGNGDCFYHVEDIDEEEDYEKLVALLDIDGDADIPF